ncbi:MAG: adenosine kinase [Bacteroidales bacterium]|nr:adenosine kinase [Bacteroidales bacterium]
MATKNILGIGNALVDILTLIPDDNILKQLNLPKGTMQHVDAQTSKKVGEALRVYGSSMAAGGSTANMVSGASKLGVSTGYIGKVADDELGKFFEEAMVKTGVKPMMLTTATPTGCAQAMISNDGERTFATYLGAALELSAEDLRPEMFDGWDILFVEGYLVQNIPLVDRILELAKGKGMTVAIDMASFNVVEQNRDYLNDRIKRYIDIVFANEDESRALTGQEDPVEALHAIAAMCDIAVVKVGAKGSYLQHGDAVVKIDPIPAKVIDTTGAGDLWAGGFMASYAKGEALERCAKTGALVAANIIEVLGAKMDEERWQKIFKLLEQL